MSSRDTEDGCVSKVLTCGQSHLIVTISTTGNDNDRSNGSQRTLGLEASARGQEGNSLSHRNVVQGIELSSSDKVALQEKAESVQRNNR